MSRNHSDTLVTLLAADLLSFEEVERPGVRSVFLREILSQGLGEGQTRQQIGQILRARVRRGNR